MTPEKWIRAAIDERGIKQTFIADKLGMNAQKLNFYLTGRVKMTVPVFLGLCDALGLDPMEYRKAAGDGHA